MKTLILLVLLSSVTTYAAETPCKGKAIQAAMSAYLKGATIQGDAPMPSYKMTRNSEDQIAHSVVISGGNDEGESWAVTYRVKTKQAPSCKVTSVVKVKVESF